MALSHRALSIDDFVWAAEHSVLHPLFSLWVPLFLLHRGSNAGSTPVLLSSLYLATTSLLWLLRVSDRVWTNKAGATLSSVLSLSSLEWPSQVVLVTGAAGGIGSELVKRLGEKGATVVAVDVVERPSGLGPDVNYFQCNLANHHDIEDVVKRIQAEVGHPTILINNAGVVQGKLLLDLTRDELEQTFDVNVLAQFSLLKLLLPEMLRERQGHIVTVSSVFGLVGSSQLSDYASSKHASMGLHESLRYELKYRYNDSPIRTTLLIPGQVLTPLFASLPPLSRPVSFLAPLVHPTDLAASVIDALDRQQSREIFLPFYGSKLWVIKGLPSWARDGLVWFSGANEAMREFVKTGERKEKRQ